MKLTRRSAPWPPREPTSASTTVGVRVGTMAGCQEPQAVRVAATSVPACTKQGESNLH